MLYSAPPPDTAAQVQEKDPKKYELRLTPDYLKHHEGMRPPFTLKEISTEGFSLTKKYEQKNSGGIEIYVPKHDHKFLKSDEIPKDLQEKLIKKHGIDGAKKLISKAPFAYQCKDDNTEYMLNMFFGREIKVYSIFYKEGKIIDFDNFLILNLSEGLGYDEITFRKEHLFTEIGATIPNYGRGEGVLNFGISSGERIIGPFSITGDLLPLSTDRGENGKMLMAGRIKGYLVLDKHGSEIRYRVKRNTDGTGYSNIRLLINSEKINRKLANYLEKLFGGEIYLSGMYGGSKGGTGTKNTLLFGFVIKQ